MKVYYLRPDGTAVRYNSAEIMRLANMAGQRGLDGTFWFRGVPPSTRGGAWNWEAPPEAVVGIGRFAPCLSFGITAGRIVYQHERMAPADDGYIARFSWARAGFAVYAQPPEEPVTDPIRQVQDSLRAETTDGAADDWPAAGRQGHLRVLRWFGSGAVKEAAQGWWYALGPEWHWTPRHQVFNHLIDGADFVVPVRVGEEALAYVYGRRSTSILSPDHLGERIDLEPGEYLLRHPLPVVNVD